MKNLPLTDPSAAELYQCAVVGFGSFSVPLRNEILVGLRPPVVVPPDPVTPPDLSGYSKVLRMSFRPWNYGSGHLQLMTADYPGGFDGNDCLIVSLTTPAVVRENVYGGITWCEYGGPPWPRDLTISALPGDFEHPLGGAPKAKFTDATGGTIYFSIGPNNNGGGQWAALALPSTTYYLNVRNTNRPSMQGLNLLLEFSVPV